MGKEYIISRGIKLEVRSVGKEKFAYDDNMQGSGCCKIIAERFENGVKILTSCRNPLYQPAIKVGLMGCMVNCEQHLREYFKNQTLEEAIDHKVEYTHKIRAGELICDVCGAKGARPCPGEGQNLCNKCNDREGINRWS
jgi:hypothetical protein